MTPDSRGSLLTSGARSLLIGGAALSAIVAVSVAGANLFRLHLFTDSSHARSSGRTAAPAPGLGLRAEVHGSGLQVTWNREAGPVRNATSGSLTFQEGETRKALQLSQTTARAGAVFYAAQGPQVQVALTIYAPDHVASESISAALPVAAAQSPETPAADGGSEEPVLSHDREGSAPNPEAEGQPKASQAKASAPPKLPKHDATSRPTPRGHRVAAAASTTPASPREEPAAAVAPVPELAAPVSNAGSAPGMVAIRVEVDETGRVVEAVLLPQQNLNPEFGEAALEMARDWHFEASPTGNRHTMRVLKFRQSVNR